MNRSLQVARAACRLIGHRATLGERLRLQLADLGGAWVKLGQFLSLRYDLFPADICDALRPLQGRIPGIGGSYAREIVARELGADALASFEDEPAASATVGQVHRATLHGGRRVAVKVLRPGIADLYRQDIRILRRLSYVTAVLNAVCPARLVPRLRMGDMVRELASVLSEEVDLRFEAANLKRMRKLLRKHKGVSAPRVHLRLCTAQVMVCDWVDGMVMRDLLALSADERARWLKAHRLTGKKLARWLVQSLNRQVYEDNRYHGDLNPGNDIIAKRRHNLIDFGSASASERGFLYTFMRFSRALASKEYGRAADCYLLLCIPPRMSIVKRTWIVLSGRQVIAPVRRDLVRVMSEWATRAETKTIPFKEKSIDRLSTDMMQVIMKAGGSMQWSWLRLTRAFSTMESIVGVLWPELDYSKELARYLESADARETIDSLRVSSTINSAARIFDRLEEFSQLKTSSIRMDGIEGGF